MPFGQFKDSKKARGKKTPICHVSIERKHGELVVINQKGPNTSMILVLFLLYFRPSPSLLTLSLLKNSLKAFGSTTLRRFIPPAPWVTCLSVQKQYERSIWQPMFSGRHLGGRKVNV